MMTQISQVVTLSDLLITEGMNIVEKNYSTQEKWLIEMGQNLQQWGNINNYIIDEQAKTLWVVWSIWEKSNNQQGVSLDLESKSKWEYDFYNWAKNFTKNIPGKEPAEITIHNKITTYRDWEGECIIEYPEYVEIPIRDNQDNIVDGLTERIEFDPKDCAYGKKLVCRATARKGEMTPHAWSALRDSHVTVGELKNIIKNKPSIEQSDFFIFEDNGIIYGCENGKSLPVMQTLIENSSEELFTKTICHILKASGIQVPLEYQL